MAHLIELSSIDLVYAFNQWQSRSFSELATQRVLYRNTDSSIAKQLNAYPLQFSVIQFNISFKLFWFI